MKKRVIILGSTGSIGRAAIKYIANNIDKFEVVAIAAYSNADLLADQVALVRPQQVVIAEAHFSNSKLRASCLIHEAELYEGTGGLLEITSHPVDIVLSAISGFAGLAPTINAIKAGSDIALANKESLVCAGNLIRKLAEENEVSIIPVDSEHSAIFQVFDFEEPELVEKIILTASGGPFRSWTKEDICCATINDALKHPNWNMGRKITIDSATMMNKVLEFAEAYHFFPVSHEQIEIIIHPQSIIHSMVEYVDGSVLAQMGVPTMEVPISYALNWPMRGSSSDNKLKFHEIGSLTFEKPDTIKFPCLEFIKEIYKSDAIGTIINAANEVAVEAFLDGKVKFYDIYKLISHVVNNVSYGNVGSLEEIEELDKIIRLEANKLLNNIDHSILCI